jgi:hypothetical protein
MWAWRFGFFTGWLLRKHIEVAARVTMAGVRATSRVNSASTTAQLYRKNISIEEENARLAGCRAVVLQYAEALGCIARECISRDELEKFIDHGIQPNHLAWDIQRRSDRKPVLCLDTYPNQPAQGFR